MKKFLKDFRILLLLISLISSFLFIHLGNLKQGVYVQSTRTPASQCLPSSVILTEINGYRIRNLTDYYSIISNISSETVRVKFVEEKLPYFYSQEQSCAFLPLIVDNSTYLGIGVQSLRPTKIDFGTEIQGGVKVLLKPERALTQEEVSLTMNVLEQRLNVFGIKEIPITYISDLSGDQYFKIEFAGGTEEEVKSLLEQAGHFEARIGNETVFTGKDVLDVCLVGTQSNPCAQVIPINSDNGIVNRFSFTVYLTESAAEKFANITSVLSSVGIEPDCYLNQTIDFYIDDVPVEGGKLNIACDLKNKTITTPSITGIRKSKKDAQDEMRRLQAILKSGNLPSKLNIVQTEKVSPSLGESFAKNTLFVFLFAIIMVDLVIALRYKKLKIVLPIIFISLSEIFITLGVAALIHWTIDLAGIVGIIASVGTGVDDQIVITDEVIRGEREEKIIGIKQRIKKAFGIIFASFAVMLATMLPLFWSHAGLLKGFAVTTIIATSIGILITRPAYGRIIERILKE